MVASLCRGATSCCSPIERLLAVGVFLCSLHVWLRRSAGLCVCLPCVNPLSHPCGCILFPFLLGHSARAHASWFVVGCLQALRDAVKLWGPAYSEPCDVLLTRMIWCWVGHALRMPDTSLVRFVLFGLQSAASASSHGGSRHKRAGPNNSGHRNVSRYMRHKYIDVTLASAFHLSHSPLVLFDDVADSRLVQTFCGNTFHCFSHLFTILYLLPKCHISPQSGLRKWHG